MNGDKIKVDEASDPTQKPSNNETNLHSTEIEEIMLFGID